MTRPQMIRADTIDLQDQGNPSAKDHSRQPTNPAALGDGPPAPHQAIALKNAGYEPLEIHHSRSPRASQDLSGKELQLLHDIDGHDGIEEDPLGIHLQSNGDDVEHHGEDGEVGDQDGDDSLDDDMMDKISSSPSIDSGGYGLPWMNANSSVMSTPEAAKKKQHEATDPETPSSSPFLSTPEHFPLSLFQPDQRTPTSEDHHQGEYPAQGPSRMPRDDSFSSEARDRLMPLVCETRTDYFREDVDSAQDAYDADFDDTALHNFLIPADDPLLDNSFDDGGHLSPASPTGSDSPKPGWNDQAPDSNDYDDDDDTEGISFTDSRFIDSGWGGECLREIEDISFEFVYALHTFVATVEGQANATKGDTMVLLDDSNSYWWLVRVVKDSSIGYLPAEHIETPTERLARLNKHRNIDLSQAMLGDSPEKSKNPLKKAMRRRNAKTVQFAPPTFYEPSDNEYSSDEEGEGGEPPELTDAGGLASQNPDSQSAQEEGATVEPLKIRSQQNEAAEDEIQADMQAAQDEPQGSNLRSSEDSALRSEEGASIKSRNGTLRNTDSFFKDDTQETRKITITPVLFRDDSSSSTLTPTDSKEPRTRPSLETSEKVASPSDKSKDGKDGKSKEKKHGMLSGLFKRKDRKSKSQSPGDDEDPDWLAKEISNQPRQSPPSRVSSESQPKSSSDSQPKGSSDLTSQDTRSGRASPGSRSPSRQGSKLQKPQPLKTSPTKRSPSREGQVSPTKAGAAEQPTPVLAPTELYPTSTQIGGPAEHLRSKGVQPERIAAAPDAVQYPEPKHVAEKPPLSPTESKSRGGAFSSIREALRLPPSPPTFTEPAKPVKAVKAKERMRIDDFDSSPEADVAPSASLPHPESLNHPEPPQREAPRHPEEPEEPKARPEAAHERLSESPVQVSPIHAVDPPPRAGTANETSSQDEPSMSTSTSSTPELVEAPHEESSPQEERTPTSTVQSSRSAPPAWSDAGLRTYLEDDTDIRDLLVVVHDTSDVRPVGPDHHVVRNLCKEENRRLGEMAQRLDGLLQDLLARKGRAGVR